MHLLRGLSGYWHLSLKRCLRWSPVLALPHAYSARSSHDLCHFCLLISWRTSERNHDTQWWKDCTFFTEVPSLLWCSCRSVGAAKFTALHKRIKIGSTHCWSIWRLGRWLWSLCWKGSLRSLCSSVPDCHPQLQRERTLYQYWKLKTKQRVMLRSIIVAGIMHCSSLHPRYTNEGSFLYGDKTKKAFFQRLPI